MLEKWKSFKIGVSAFTSEAHIMKKIDTSNINCHFFSKLTTKLIPFQKNCSICPKNFHHVKCRFYYENDTFAQNIIAKTDILNQNNNFPTN